MFESLVNWAAAHAAAMLAALFVTGTISLMAWLDAAVKDAGKDAPFWLRVLSQFVSKVGANVGHAVNSPAAQKAFIAFVLVPFAALAMGCKTVISQDDLTIGYGTNEAYNVSGPEITIAADGSITCTTGDPATQPCRAQYAGGWESWENILRAIGIPFEAVLQLVGRTLVPAPVTN